MFWIEFASKLGLALILGSAIGVERQWRQRSAGLRTNALVSLGAAAYVLLSASLTGKGGDPSRIASQIVAGIGFLGAGVIMHEGLTVQGLNTAATIWCSAAVGSLAGAGLSIEAVITTATVVLTHLVLRPLGFRLTNLPSTATQVSYLFTVRAKTEVENHIRVVLMQRLAADDGLFLHSLDSSDNGDPSVAVVTAEILANSHRDNVIEKVASMLTIEHGVTQVRWRVVGEQHDDRDAAKGRSVSIQRGLCSATTMDDFPWERLGRYVPCRLTRREAAIVEILIRVIALYMVIAHKF